MDMEKYIRYQLERLAEFTSTKGKGVSRLPFTQEALDCADYLRNEMSNIGLNAYIDGSGGVIGRLEGGDEKTVMSGSHYDSVMYGGAFDGIAGVVCAMAAAKKIIESGALIRHCLEVVAFNDEEGVRFKGGYHTSKAMLGIGDIHAMYSVTDKNGITLAEAMEKAGYTMEGYRSAKRDISDIIAFVELHIEQGPILESANKRIGIVKNIVGIRRYIIDIHGRCDHAGTTPMDMRVDAMEVASAIISRVGDISRRYIGSVATVGYISVEPNEINTIAHTVRFSLDIRSADASAIDAIFAEIKDHAETTCRRFHATCAIELTLNVPPLLMDKELRGLIGTACDKRGIPFMDINSGAGHDSLIIGEYIPTAMIFTPSVGGRSHCKEEFTRYSDLALGAEILADTLLSIK